MKKIFLLLIFTAVFFTAPLAADAPDVALVKKANLLYKDGKLDESIELYKKALVANPENFFAHMNCGYAYAAKGDNKTALTCLKKAYSLQPEDMLKQGIDKLTRLEEHGLFKSAESPLKFNKKIGFNLSALGSDTYSHDLKTGLNTGLEAIYGFGELLSVQAGLFYTQKGGKIKGISGPFVNLDYIELPAAVKISFTPIKELLTGAYFGGSAGVRISAKNKIGQIETDVSSSYELFDFALLGGIEATYPVFGLFWINADFRFSQGMADILKAVPEKITNPGFTAFFGVVF